MKIRTFLIALVLLTIVFCLTLIIFPECDSDSPISDNGRMLSCRFYDDKSFKTSLSTSEVIPLPSNKIYGGIVNHHLTADKLIAEFFKSISITQPDIVILVGPNHTGLGVKTVHTSGWSWNTPYGILQADLGITNFLTNNGMADTSFELMENEHSIATLVPYIKYFMPNTKIVPIILSSSVEKNDAVELGKLLYEEVKDKNYLVISSVDFSHYLSLAEADKKDLVTKEALLSRDINQISNMNNDYLDSPASIILLLTMMNEAGADNQIILNQSNSARILRGDSNSTTSYFVVTYY
ncbi:MAG: AmmeMemoRadiSam system protein B [Vulcanibacillus sp.]